MNVSYIRGQSQYTFIQHNLKTADSMTDPQKAHWAKAQAQAQTVLDWPTSL